MPRTLGFLLIPFALSAQTSTEAAARPASTLRPLAARLNSAVARSPIFKRSILGMHVVEIATGKTLYTRNADRMFVPASNTKLVTTAAALTRLGPDHRFVTKIVHEANGNLVLAGGGDPTMSSRPYPYEMEGTPLDPLHAIEALADEAVANGLMQVDGDVVGDDTLYPWAPYPPSWTQDDAISEAGAPVSALTLNDNVVAIHVQGGEAVGDLAIVDLNPALEYFTIDNRVTTVARGRSRVRMSRKPGSTQLLLWGWVTVGRQTTVQAAVDDPAMFAAQALYDALVRRGVAIRGQPVVRHSYGDEPSPPAEGEVLATRVSPPMTEILRVVDKVSQNLHAEIILREIGRVGRHEPTREGGIAEMDAMLQSLGVDDHAFRFEDGSGLSRNDLITPHVLTHLLESMYASKDGDTWMRDTWVGLLPVGGEDGTLSNRLCCTSDAHSIRAKTGTLARSVALSGYADSRTHGLLAFSIIVNNFAAGGNEVRAWIDRMALELVK